MNAQTKQNKKENTPIIEIELDIEELEEVIAPLICTYRPANHNETLVRDEEEIELEAEELEEVIAPGVRKNHNETLVYDVEVKF